MGIVFGEGLGDRAPTEKELVLARRDALWSLVDKMDRFQVRLLLAYCVGWMSTGARVSIIKAYEELIKEAKHILK